MEDKEKQVQELEERLEELMAREAALSKRERTLKAREALEQVGLPQGILPHLNLSSDEALNSSLQLAREIRQLAYDARPGAPKADMARLPKDAGYAQRALLYQTDRHAYDEQYKEENR